VTAGDRYDVVALGSGPGGKNAAKRLVAAGRRVAVVEAELVGGECPYWACIPSKVLLRPVEASGQSAHVAGLDRPGLDWAEIAEYRDYMVSDHHDASKAKGLEKVGIEIVRGRGRLDGPGRVAVGDRTLEADHVIIATGTASAVPPIDGLDDVDFWTNREATAMEAVPASAVVLGGGPVGLELGQLLARLGARTTLVEGAPRLLAREDPKVSDLLAGLFRDEDIDVRTGTQAVRVEAGGEGVRVHLEGGEAVEGERLVLAVGRTPRTEDIGLETVGIEPGAGGAIAVDDQCRAGENLWAVGDVTGVAPFTHVASYQAAVAADTILGRRRTADYRAVPRVVFTDPEVAGVGLTETQAAERDLDVVTIDGDLADLDRTETYGRDLRGAFQIVAARDDEVVVGAWAVGPLASEWMHPMALAVKARVSLDTLRDSMAQFPSFAEAWPTAAKQAAG
jgi:pyruvate/2-oxoglutarate dehydrogenase complex dihydrolipoamide dehydrogenase (E3) component